MPERIGQITKDFPEPIFTIKYALGLVATQVGHDFKLDVLKCDGFMCGNQEYHEELTSALLDKPCPECGANLMTEREYNVFASLRVNEKGA